MGKTVGPDQTASWVIAIAAFVINTALTGIYRGAAVFYVAVMDVYKVPRLQANLPFSLRKGIRCIAGPAVGLLGHMYGVRVVTLLGGALSTVGIALCCFAPSVFWVTMFWGCLQGIGVALANTLHQATVNQHFVKYRATAAGIALSGGSVGALLFPIMLELFVDTYGLSGAFLLTSGLVMHVIPAGMLLTEPPWLKKRKKSSKGSAKSSAKPSQEDSIKETPNLYQLSEDKSIGTEHRSPSHSVHLVAKELLKTAGEAHIYPEALKKEPAYAEMHKTSSENSVVNQYYHFASMDLDEDSKAKDINSTHANIRKLSLGQLSTVNLVEVEEKESMFKSILNVHSNLMFYMISFSMAVREFLMDILVTVIIDYICDKGMDARLGKYIICVMSVTDLVGRLGFGWVTDKEFMTAARFMILIQLLQGIPFILLPMFCALDSLMILVVVYGIGTGTSKVMFPILIGKYLPNEQSLAMGCTTFFSGLTPFVTPLLIGHFRDNEGSYDGIFYITGVLEIFSAFLWFLEPCVLRLGKSYVRR